MILVQVIDNVERKIRGEPMQPMMPWYRGFSGSVCEENVAKPRLRAPEPKKKAVGFMLWLKVHRKRLISENFTDAEGNSILVGREKVTKVAQLAGEIWRQKSETEKKTAVKEAERIDNMNSAQDHVSTSASSVKFINSGRYNVADNGNTIIVEEIPLGKWTQDYKTYLLSLVEDGLIERFSEYHTGE